MKKIAVLALAATMLMLTGCQKAADLIKPQQEDVTPETEVTEIDVTDTEEEEPATKIPISKTLNMNNEWSIMGDYNLGVTKSGKKDRILLATSAQSVNGEMQWDDSQYWTLAVLTDDGAYNLFYERVQGVVYAEVNQAYLHGVLTPVITAYVFSGNDREIRNYIYSYKEDVFVEQQIFNTKTFSTGGINNLYSTFPEYKAR